MKGFSYRHGCRVTVLGAVTLALCAAPATTAASRPDDATAHAAARSSWTRTFASDFAAAVALGGGDWRALWRDKAKVSGAATFALNAGAARRNDVPAGLRRTCEQTPGDRLCRRLDARTEAFSRCLTSALWRERGRLRRRNAKPAAAGRWEHVSRGVASRLTAQPARCLTPRRRAYDTALKAVVRRDAERANEYRRQVDLLAGSWHGRISPVRRFHGPGDYVNAHLQVPALTPGTLVVVTYETSAPLILSDGVPDPLPACDMLLRYDGYGQFVDAAGEDYGDVFQFTVQGPALADSGVGVNDDGCPANDPANPTRVVLAYRLDNTPWNDEREDEYVVVSFHPPGRADGPWGSITHDE